MTTTLRATTFAKMVDGYCNIRIYETRDDASAAAADWNGIYEDIQHHAEAKRLGAAWCVVVYDECRLGRRDDKFVLGYANGI